MSEAPRVYLVGSGEPPKRILMDTINGHVDYIRADIVEEMREALETMIEAYKGEFGSHWGEQCAEETEEHDEVMKARTALKRLEET